MNWKTEAQQCSNIEEQRYCYLRAIEDDENDDEARYQLAKLGNGAMRRPRHLVTKIPPTTRPTTNTTPRPTEPTIGEVWISGALAGCAGTLAAVAIARALGML